MDVYVRTVNSAGTYIIGFTRPYNYKKLFPEPLNCFVYFSELSVANFFNFTLHTLKEINDILKQFSCNFKSVFCNENYITVQCA